jgi:surface antigen
LECADGKKGIETPGYWELFAQFYYRDIAAPEYCRVYSRPNHAFKTFGKTCLQQDGKWEVK